MGEFDYLATKYGGNKPSSEFGFLEQKYAKPKTRPYAGSITAEVNKQLAENPIAKALRPKPITTPSPQQQIQSAFLEAVGRKIAGTSRGTSTSNETIGAPTPKINARQLVTRALDEGMDINEFNGLIANYPKAERAKLKAAWKVTVPKYYRKQAESRSGLENINKSMSLASETSGRLLSENAPEVLQGELAQKNLQNIGQALPYFIPGVGQPAMLAAVPEMLVPVKGQGGESGDLPIVGMAKEAYHRLANPLETINEGQAINSAMDLMLLHGLGKSVIGGIKGVRSVPETIQPQRTGVKTFDPQMITETVKPTSIEVLPIAKSPTVAKTAPVEEARQPAFTHNAVEHIPPFKVVEDTGLASQLVGSYYNRNPWRIVDANGVEVRKTPTGGKHEVRVFKTEQTANVLAEQLNKKAAKVVIPDVMDSGKVQAPPEPPPAAISDAPAPKVEILEGGSAKTAAIINPQSFTEAWIKTGRTSEEATALTALAEANRKYHGESESTYYPRMFKEITSGGKSAPGALLQEHAPVWYSQLERTLDDFFSKQSKASANQVRGFLNGKVKPEELKWSGFDKWLNEHPGVTREQAMDFIQENQVQVQEVTKGGSKGPIEWQQSGDMIVSRASGSQFRIETLPNNRYLLEAPGGTSESFPTLAEAQARAEQYRHNAREDVTPTKFSNYVTPGGENYRELLFTLPKGEPYTSPHWDEPNVLAHARFNERVDSSGKKVLHIEEIQSDWHQAGRQKGYSDELPNGYYVENHGPVPLNWHVRNETGDAVYSARSRESAIEGFNAYGGRRVPSAPFAKTWPDLVMKRMIRYAAENGFDRITWATGEQQAARYDLSKHIKEIYHWKEPDGKIGISAYDLNDTPIIDAQTYKPDDLPNVVGKEMADKIISGVGESGTKYGQPEEVKVLSGLDLNVGGAGMKGFYDKMLPEVANKIGKKYGARVDESKILTPNEGDPTFGVYEDGSLIAEFERRNAAWDYVEDSKLEHLTVEEILPADENVGVHSLDITQSLKNAVLNEGQPLFQKGKGSVEFDASGKAIIRAFSSSDVSTAAHELGHVFRKNLKAEDVSILESAYKVKNGEWKRQHEEMFARGFERYLREGKAPTTALKQVFEQFKQWLKTIYQTIKGTPIADRIPVEARSVYDRMLGAENATVQEPVVKVGSQSGVMGSITHPKLPSVSSEPPVSLGKISITPSKIQKSLANAFAPIRTGRLQMKRASGEYHIGPEGIRIKQYGDLPTISHEVGHHIHKLLFPEARTPKGNLSATAFPREYWRELASMAYPGAKGKVAEGYAEFTRMWLTDPAEAVKRAPNFYKHYESTLKQYPDVLKELSKARTGIKTWIDTPDAMKVRATISHDEPNIKRPITLDSIATKFIDELRTLQRASEDMTRGKDVPIEQRPYEVGWLARGRGGKATAWLEYGVMDTTGNKIGKSLRDILQPVGKDIDLFADYLVARHAQEINTPMPLPKKTYQATLDLVNQRGLGQRFDSAAKAIYQYQNQLLDLLVDSGIIDSKQAAQWRQRYQSFVPLYRVYDERPGVRGGAGKGYETSSPVRRRKGSGRAIINPLESLIKNTFMYHDIVARHQVMRTIYDLAKTSEGAAKWAEIIPVKKKPVTVKVSDVIKLHEENPLWASIFEEIGMSPEDAVTVFKPNNKGQAADNVVQLYVDGKPAQMRLDPELYNVITSFDSESAGLAMKLLEIPAKTLRTGATLTPEFTLRNPMRDIVEAMLYSNANITPVDIVKGMFHAFKKDDLYYKWLNSGGAQSTMMAYDRNYLQGEMRKLLQQSPKDKLNAWKRQPLEHLRELLQPFEEGTRVAEFGGGTKWGTDTSLSTILESGLSSRDITIDFSRGGTVGRKVNRVSAFFNAGMQGGSKMAREIRKNPARFFRRGAMYITAPTIALYMVNKDNPEYQRLQEWEKDLYWHVFVGDAHLRIPKPFNMGVVFGAIPERIMRDVVGNDTHAFDDIEKTAYEAFVPAIIPTLMIPWLAVRENKSFTGSPIVPRREENLPPQMQFGSQTSAMARKLGEVTKSSPRKIDYLISGYTGGLGKYLVNGLSAIAEMTGVIPVAPKPSLTPAQYPAAKGFMQNPYSAPVYTERLYDEKQELEQKKVLSENSKGEKFTTKDIKRLYDLKRRTDALSGMRKVERGIQDATKLTEVKTWQLRAGLRSTSESINDLKRDLLIELSRIEDDIATGKSKQIERFKSIGRSRAKSRRKAAF